MLHQLSRVRCNGAQRLHSLAGFSKRFNSSSKPIEKVEFKKVLVANRGEIAIRAFRSLREMGIKSVAIFAHEDRKSMHLMKADQAFQVGEGKEPVAAYLDVEDIIETALKHNVDAIHPGYGFLSERADFAKAVNDAGMRFIGPSPDVMKRMGDKVAARQSAISAGVRVIPGTDKAVNTAEEAVEFAQEFGTPIILKAAYGGGGRGMRRVDDLSQVGDAFRMASHEALANFGNGSMFIERFIETPRHIEVQLMGDHQGNLIHLYERDCSVQRRHQKVVELAPAPCLDPQIRQNILNDALKLARHVGYQNAGTVEFLLDKEGKHYFIEVNARLQVEHTVTEEVTGVDLMKTMIRVAEGYSLPEQGLTQDTVKLNGAAIQCRLTTEDPAKNFQPDTGRLTVYRTGEGMGIRLDGAAYAGADITPHYDSLLCKIIAKAATHEEAAIKLTRALWEARIRGVKVNKPFVLNVLKHPDFLRGSVDTSFIDANPQLFDFTPTLNRGMKLLQFLSDVKVNGSLTPLATDLPPARAYAHTPEVPEGEPPKGWKDILTKEGPKGFAKAVRAHQGLLLTDTTMRDAHQSLLATRVRTYDMLRISPHVSHNMSQLLSIENWGGATFDVSMKFLREDPWERLQSMRKVIPNVPFQCLLRGANAMGYSNYPDNVVEKFCDLSVQAGMDIFRIFDSLNYVPNMAVGIEAVHKAGGVVEAAISYTGDISDKSRKKYDLQYYLDLTDEIMKLDVHILAIKDMAGLLKPGAAKLLISEIRSRYPDVPIHIHSHDTTGIAVATTLAAAEAGADVVDCAIDSMSGMTSQGSMGAVVHTLKGTPYDTKMDEVALEHYNQYWETTRRLYGPFECTTTMRSGNSAAFRHEIPGGQYTNLQFQSFSLNLGDQFAQVCENYSEANEALGGLIKVTPSSKVVGDLAQFMTQKGIKTAKELVEQADHLSFPTSVVGFLRGELGQPHYGFPEELRKKVIRDKTTIDGRPGASIPPMDLEAVRKDLEKKHQKKISDYDVMSSVMFPAEFDEMTEFRANYGPVECLPTDLYFAGPEDNKEMNIELEGGKNLLVTLKSVGVPDEQGIREVDYEYNGHHRNLYVRDKAAVTNQKVTPKAKKSDPGHIGAPMRGKVLEVKVKVGDKVAPKQTLAILSAMKMEMAVESKIAGTVTEVLSQSGEEVDAEDLLIVVKPE